MKSSDKINSLKKSGYDIIKLGKHIKAYKEGKLFIGSVSKVHKIVFGY